MSNTTTVRNTRPFLILAAILCALCVGQCWLPGDAGAAPGGAKWQRQVVVRGVPFPDRLALVLDRSGSMDGKPWAKAVAEARKIAEGMSDQGRIRFYVFDGVTERDPRGWISLPDGDALKAAFAWIDAHGPDRGGTNMAVAAETALADPVADGVIFITDGQPNGGIDSTCSRIVAANDARKEKAVLGCVIIGNDKDANRLGLFVATEGGGAYVRLIEKDAVPVEVVR